MSQIKLKRCNWTAVGTLVRNSNGKCNACLQQGHVCKQVSCAQIIQNKSNTNIRTNETHAQGKQTTHRSTHTNILRCNYKCAAKLNERDKAILIKSKQQPASKSQRPSPNHDTETQSQPHTRTHTLTQTYQHMRGHTRTHTFCWRILKVRFRVCMLHLPIHI